MIKKSERTKQKIIQTANRLFYRRGYNRTSFTDIVDASGVPRGNIYYYFRTKDEILLAALEYRMNNIEKMLRDWDQKYKTPQERLKRFVKVLIAGHEATSMYGCPIGSINMELGKEQPELQAHAGRMFRRLLDYFRYQFEAMGHSAQHSRHLAMQLLSRAQGVSMMAHVMRDPQIMQDAEPEFEHWIDTLTPNPTTHEKPA